MKKLSFIFLLLALAIAGCRDDIDESSVTTVNPVPPVISSFNPKVELIQTSVRGEVIDEFGEPVQDAKVSWDGGTTTTNTYGHFFITDEMMNALGSVVRVEKEGYFEGNRRFFPKADIQNRVWIELISKSFDHSFEAASGGVVELSSGARIDFSADVIAQSDGSTYTGQVRVAAAWLNPDEISTMTRMPGSLQGVSIENEEVSLTTYGMMAVELEDAFGNSLNIQEGKTATLTMPIPESIRSSAPQQIPLWSFYEPYGLWAQESSADLISGAYVGEVSHFSFWNCDYPEPLVNFEARLIDDNGNPLVNSLVTLKIPGNPRSGAAVSDTSGRVSGKVPKDNELILEVYNYCHEIIHTDNIGPFSSDVDFGDIVISNGGVTNIELTGRVLDCNNNPISNALIKISFDSWFTTYEYVDGSGFNIDVLVCQSTTDIDVIAINVDSLTQSDVIHTAATDTDLGDIDVCDIQLENYVRITVDDLAGSVETVVYYTTDSVFFSTDYTGFDSWGVGQEFLSVIFYGGTTGDYSAATDHRVYIDDRDRGWLIGVQGETFTEFIVTEYGGNIGDPVKGHFSGVLLNYFPGSPPTEVEVTGEFSVNRQ